MEYIQLTEINEIPNISAFSPFKALLVIEDEVSKSRQRQISDWLVEMGGLCLTLCGVGSEGWAKSIRQSNLDQVDIQSMEPEQFVMIVEFQNDIFRNVFWHAKKYAKHTHVKLSELVIVHISNENRAVDYLSIFNKV